MLCSQALVPNNQLGLSQMNAVAILRIDTGQPGARSFPAAALM
jgi:hypothetical protein